MAISKQKIALFFKLSISITVFGALFKFIPWFLILLGVLGMVVFHSIQFFQNRHKTPLDYSRFLLLISFACNYSISVLTLPYGHVLTLLTKVALITFLLLYIKKILFFYRESASTHLSLTSIGQENLSNLLADLATVYIVIASLFKILHWEFGILNANVLLVIGLFSALISILANTKSVEG